MLERVEWVWMGREVADRVGISRVEWIEWVLLDWVWVALLRVGVDRVGV